MMTSQNYLCGRHTCAVHLSNVIPSKHVRRYFLQSDIHEFLCIYFFIHWLNSCFFLLFQTGIIVRNHVFFVWNFSVCKSFSELPGSLKLHQTCHCWEMFKITESLSVTTAVQWRQLLSDDSCSVTTAIQWRQLFSYLVTESYKVRWGLVSAWSLLFSD